ncbi:MAG: PH domain-containing protein [Promethearchaeota archaeon]
MRGVSKTKKEGSRKVLYHEWVPLPTALKIIASFLVLLTIVLMGILTLLYQFTDYSSLIFVSLFSAPLLFLLFMILNYRGIDIKITPDEVIVRYGVINRKRIHKDDITGCETTRTPFRRYGGIGIRYGLDGSWAYTTSLGPAVRISFIRGRPFVFSSKHPEKICNIIREITDQKIAPSA